MIAESTILRGAMIMLVAFLGLALLDWWVVSQRRRSR